MSQLEPRSPFVAVTADGEQPDLGSGWEAGEGQRVEFSDGSIVVVWQIQLTADVDRQEAEDLQQMRLRRPVSI